LTTPIPDVKPPNYPWQQITYGTDKIATMTYYYSDENSPLIPIRDVSHQMDAKRDPNIETKTYGLFSHCCKGERKAIVKKGICTQFFCTSRGKPRTRVLTGYYQPKWYCEIETGDFAIAAERVRFVSPGFVLSDIVPYLEGFPIDCFFRTWKYIKDETVIKRLILLLNTANDATNEYIAEVHKLENYALQQYNRMYQDKLQGFSWSDAGELMRKEGLI